MGQFSTNKHTAILAIYFDQNGVDRSTKVQIDRLESSASIESLGEEYRSKPLE